MVTKDTGIIEAVQNHPEIMEVFAEYGLGCIGCMAAHFETIGQGAGAHGIDVDALIEDINKVIAEQKQTNNIVKRDKYCIGIFSPHKKMRELSPAQVGTVPCFHKGGLCYVKNS